MQADSTVSTAVSEDGEQERAGGAGGAESAGRTPGFITGGIDYYEQELAPELAAVAKLAQRIGQGKALAKQAVEANRGTRSGNSTTSRVSGPNLSSRPEHCAKPSTSFAW